MSREVKRVPMDFDWPLKKRWHGYVNPYRVPRCVPCEGTGRSPEARKFDDQWSGEAPFDPVEYGAKPLTLGHPEIQALARENVRRAPHYYGSGEAAVRREAGRLFGLFKGSWCHHLIQADVDALLAAGRLCDLRRSGAEVTPDAVNAWSIRGMGHDAMNQHVCLVARCEREGVERLCASCGGSGEDWPDEESKARCEAWRRTDPPAGAGWQMWETTSEGSPISPVFASPEGLANWLADTKASAFAGAGASYEVWLRMIQGHGSTMGVGLASVDGAPPVNGVVFAASIAVTDPDIDAPDGSEVEFEDGVTRRRVGGTWEPVAPRPVEADECS